MITNKRQVTAEYECANMGNQYPVCSPTYGDTWYQGSEYKLIWNYNYPYYIVNNPVEDNQLDFHLYYQKNYAYQHIRAWNNLSLLDGSLTLTVNNSWFPTAAPEGQNKTWTMFGWFIPSGNNATQMLIETQSTYPRPFNWTVVQAYDPNYTNENPDGTTNSDANDSSSNSNDGDGGASGLPGWAIAVIVIACVAFVAALGALAAVIFMRRRQKQQRQPMTMTEAAAIAAARHNKQPPPGTEATGGTTKSDGMSIYSNTPMVAAAGSQSRDSATTEASTSTSRHRGSPPADTFRNLMYTEWKNRGMPNNNPATGGSSSNNNNLEEQQHDEEEELRRRRLGEALLQRELEEEGAAVKHTDRRPMTVAPPEALESKAVVLERQDGNHSSPPQ